MTCALVDLSCCEKTLKAPMGARSLVRGLLSVDLNRRWEHLKIIITITIAITSTITITIAITITITITIIIIVLLEAKRATASVRLTADEACDHDWFLSVLLSSVPATFATSS